MEIQTANQLRGRAIGSIFFACFGTGWLFMAMIAKQAVNSATVSWTISGMVVLLVTAAYLLRQARRWPSVPNDPAVGRAFAWVNTIQWIAVAAVAFSFAKLHIDAYAISAIAGIIGLHMFPLARLFRYPLHYATGGLLTAWAAASALLVPVEQMQGTAAFGTGLILWLSATVALAIALQAARQPIRSLAS
jgi:hypothetical protein